MTPFSARLAWRVCDQSIAAPSGVHGWAMSQPQSPSVRLTLGASATGMPISSLIAGAAAVASGSVLASAVEPGVVASVSVDVEGAGGVHAANRVNAAIAST
jgi:hypothetical protein